MTVAATATPKTHPTLTIVNPDRLHDPAPLGYSHAVVASGATRIAYISGQAGFDATGGLSPDFEVQVKNTFANLVAVLDGIGAKPGQVIKITVYVVDHDQAKLGPLTRHVVETFGTALPAQTLVAVPRLALDGMLFEVEAVAALD